jgi:predicted ferric reductase
VFLIQGVGLVTHIRVQPIALTNVMLTLRLVISSIAIVMLTLAAIVTLRVVTLVTQLITGLDKEGWYDATSM